MSIIFANGQSVPVGSTVTIDHEVSDFRVRLRSMSAINAETVKRLLQNHFEVIEVEQLDERQIALAVSRD